LNSAVLADPTWRKPVGLGANRVRTSDMADQHTGSRAVASEGSLCYFTEPPKLLFSFTFHPVGEALGPCGRGARAGAGCERCKA
jgi:hypothetical protein